MDPVGTVTTGMSGDVVCGVAAGVVVGMVGVVVSPIGISVKSGVVGVAAVDDPVAPPPSMEA